MSLYRTSYGRVYRLTSVLDLYKNKTTLYSPFLKWHRYIVIGSVIVWIYSKTKNQLENKTWKRVYFTRFNGHDSAFLQDTYPHPPPQLHIP